MTQAELLVLLEELIATWENEVIEFKEANDNFALSEIGKYFSALSNEANLRGVESGWLVFGVKDKGRRVVGTQFREDGARLQSLKAQIAQGCEPSASFREIHEVAHVDGRVILFEVPAAPRGIPISWQGHYYARDGESLAPLSYNKQDEIRGQTLSHDWSAVVVEGATLDDLDVAATEFARAVFTQKNANRISSDEIASGR